MASELLVHQLFRDWIRRFIIRASVVAIFAARLACFFGTTALWGCSASNPLSRLQAEYLTLIPRDGVTVNFCTDPAVEEKYNIKTIVIFDHSGSNKENYLMNADGTGAPALINGAPVISQQYATDPTGHTRYGDVATPGTLLNYLHSLPANDPKDPSRFFSLIDFNDGVETYPANNSGFTSDIADFYLHVQQDAGGANGTPTDGGSTSYLKALQSAYTVINNDIQLADRCAKLAVGTASPGSWCPTPGAVVSSSYVVVFMSDGSPITSISGIGIDSGGHIVVTGQIQITKEATNLILGQVATMVGLTANTRYVAGINLFTIYYYYPGNVDLSSQSLLANMAKIGNGIAYNALSGSNIDYNKFVPPSKLIKYTLADIFVTNSSVTAWTDGHLRRDTDGDGIPDDVELAWGSSPYFRDTYGSGVSDMVRYQLANGATCIHKDSHGICADAVPDYQAGACAGITSAADPARAGAILFRSSDPNGLNDCEKILLSDAGGIANPDSNGDLIPDWLEFKNQVPFQLGTSSAANSPALDGLSTYQKIKTSLPTTLPIYQIVDPKPAIYDLALQSSTTQQDCYKLTVKSLPIIGSNNTVRVDVILKSELLQDRLLYRTAQKSFADGSTALDFQDWHDPAEIANHTWSLWP